MSAGDAGPWDDTPLEHALTYAALGLRVVPIRPGYKYPPMQGWQRVATTDEAILRDWWARAYAGHGCGLALGRRGDHWVFALDLDEHTEGVSGRDTLEALLEGQPELPTGPRAITGAGGLHLLFRAPVEIRNGTLGPGLDVRGEGGQIVVAPTVHPDTGRQYAWELERAPWELDIPEAPEWLWRLAAPPAPRPRPSMPSMTSSADPTPAEWLRAHYQWATELEHAGWEYAGSSPEGDQWVRPGKDARQGISALLHEGGPFVVFSTDASMAAYRLAGSENRDGSVSLSPLQLEAAIHHDGDVSAASSAVRARMPARRDYDLGVGPAEPPPASEAPAEPEPTIYLDWGAAWARDRLEDDWLAYPLLQTRRSVALYAKAKTGKSWVALCIAASLATGGPIFGQPNGQGPRHVIYLDYEMALDDVMERLEQLGYGPETDLSHLHYALAPRIPALDLEAGAERVCHEAAQVAAELVIIDTMGRAIAGDENDADSYRAYARLTGMRLKAQGVAVLRLDHAGKDDAKGQRGSSAKNDDVDAVVKVEPTNSGWRLVCTMQRGAAIPERIELAQRHHSDDRMSVVLAAERDYADGTKALVERMRQLGIDGTWTANRAMATMRAADAGARKTRVLDALRWMQVEAGARLADGGSQGQDGPENHRTEEPDGPDASGPDMGTARNRSSEDMEEPPPPYKGGGIHPGPTVTDGLPGDVF